VAQVRVEVFDFDSAEHRVAVQWELYGLELLHQSVGVPESLAVGVRRKSRGNAESPRAIAFVDLAYQRLGAEAEGADFPPLLDRLHDGKGDARQHLPDAERTSAARDQFVAKLKRCKYAAVVLRCSGASPQRASHPSHFSLATKPPDPHTSACRATWSTSRAQREAACRVGAAAGIFSRRRERSTLLSRDDLAMRSSAHQAGSRRRKPCDPRAADPTPQRTSKAPYGWEKQAHPGGQVSHQAKTVLDVHRDQFTESECRTLFVDPELMKPPVNVLRASLHPRGLAPLIVNLPEWRGHLLDRLKRQWRITRDPALDRLLQELTHYPTGRPTARSPTGSTDEFAVPLKLRTQRGTLSFLSTVTVFGTPVEITLSELTLEAFYPADPKTLAILQEDQLPATLLAQPIAQPNQPTNRA
jgi:hypothetical protein